MFKLTACGELHFAKKHHLSAKNHHTFGRKVPLSTAEIGDSKSRTRPKLNPKYEPKSTIIDKYSPGGATSKSRLSLGLSTETETIKMHHDYWFSGTEA